MTMKIKKRKFNARKKNFIKSIKLNIISRDKAFPIAYEIFDKKFYFETDILQRIYILRFPRIQL